MGKDHEHDWAYDHRSCCHVLKCVIPGCERFTRAYYINGIVPQPGQKVRLLSDQETIEVVK